ncbi:MAG: exodeoxyribonuclease VII large subunit [Oscillospiraceae bacterium]|nr:exodeoxyribonuclease VII large subunit [Oscillospiraceae bacterium]
MEQQQQMIFSVSEANGFIKALLDRVPQLQEIYVRGEISNYKLYPSGHHYFTLKDAEGALRCVMFRGSASRLRFRPENGMKVIVFGRISVFPRDGAYQLYVNSLTAEGVGDLHVAFEQLKEKLWKEGLFDAAHKKPLPRYPGTIAVITSSAGAAVHDMLRILNARWPLSKVVLLPVRVQGAEAPPEIAGALRYANRWRVADVIITGRGGGSIEDLWAFNDERVARAIYDSEIPVISAVGHEPDVTISDFVADARASTPSNAAEIVVPDQNELRRRLGVLSGRMAHSERARLDALHKRMTELARKRVLTDPTAFVSDKRMLLDYTRRNLVSAAQRQQGERARRFATLCAALDALSPLKVLARGYAVARAADGSILKSAAEAGVGDCIDVTLGSGTLDCVVQARHLGGEEHDGTHEL